MSEFIHLHVHSEYSALDGLCRPSEMVAKTKELRQPAIAITDHGFLSGVPEFYKESKKQSILPILGQEFYIVPDSGNKEKGDAVVSNRHIIMLALNTEGWHTMVELSSVANDRSRYHYKPRLDHDVLRHYKKAFKNIAVTTACLSGEVARALQSGGRKSADRVLSFYSNIFPNLYLEIQRHPIEPEMWKRNDEEAQREVEFEQLQSRLNEYLVSASKRLELPLLITNDAHFVDKSHSPIHDLALALQTGADFDDPNRFSFNGTGYWLKSTKEMKALWSDEPKIWKQSQASIKEIATNAASIHVPEMETTTWHMPLIPSDKSDPVEKFRDLCWQGLIDKELDGLPEYVSRLEHELNVIREANFEKIFLIVYDYVNWARNNGILVGPGRGSMVGTLTSYLLGITLMDPIKYRLLFERAINPARPSIPDFDIDFEPERIEEVIDYVRKTYGEENVVKIGTNQKMAPRGTLKGILKAFKVPFQEANAITQALPETVDITNNRVEGDMSDFLNDFATPSLKRLMKKEPLIRESAEVLHGLTKSYGKHAAGVVISDDTRPIRTELPLMLIPTSDTYVSQYDMDGVKSLHLVKFDFLSLSTLTMIAKAIKFIGYDPFETHTEYDDAETYKMMARGDLTTVFQFQGGAMKQCIMAMGADHFEDLVSVNAIARPGSIKFLDPYVENKKNPQNIEWPTKKIKPILENTFGIILFQEQVMQIVKDLAGWDDLGADKIKEAIKSKSGTAFDEMYGEFIEGCKKNGISKDAAEIIWKNIDDYRSYGFNRAHAVAYSAIGYQTAYLLRHHPLEWLTAVLSTTDKKNFEDIIDEIRRRDIKILPPDVNKSGLSFTIERDAIRFGLTQIAGVGDKTAQIILDERDRRGEFKSIKDFNKRMRGTSIDNRARMAALSNSGSLRCVGVKHKYADEVKYLKIPISRYPLDSWKKELDKMLKSKSNLEIINGGYDGDVIWGGLVTKVKTHTTKRGDPMAFISVSYYGEAIDVVMFPQQWAIYKSQIHADNIVLVAGKYQGGRRSMICDNFRLVEGKKT